LALLPRGFFTAAWAARKVQQKFQVFWTREEVFIKNPPVNYAQNGT
jgi:hypothetical protein